MGVWLGEGPITIQRIFTKGLGSTSSDFHAAADGKGRTFSVIEVTGPDGTRLIGGYNPQSWDGHGHFHLTSTDPERTAFLFNLSMGLKFDQKKVDDVYGPEYGRYQTYNHFSYGPTFGLGHDLYTNSSLSSGIVGPYSFGANILPASGQNIYGSEGTLSVTVGRLEVFTIGPADRTPAAVPEPSATLLFLPALAVVGLLKRRRS